MYRKQPMRSLRLHMILFFRVIGQFDAFFHWITHIIIIINKTHLDIKQMSFPVQFSLLLLKFKQSTWNSPDMSGEFWKCLAKGFDLAAHFVRQEKIKDNVCQIDVQRIVWYLLDILRWNFRREFKMSSEGLEVRQTKCPARLKWISGTLV